jgi:hypothetical protein
MNVCEECGSASRDMSGICAGCGAAWNPAAPPETSNRSESRQLSPYAKLSAQIDAIGIPEVRPKKVWVAVSLALLCGPLGLIYCTATGAIVMTILSIILTIYPGFWAATLIVPPLCAIWAWRAARESASIFD